MFTAFVFFNYLLMIASAVMLFRYLFTTFLNDRFYFAVAAIILYVNAIFLVLRNISLCSLADGYPRIFYERGYSIKHVVALDSVAILLFLLIHLIKRRVDRRIKLRFEANKSDEQGKKWDEWLKKGRYKGE